jgi:hypothetical protein
LEKCLRGNSLAAYPTARCVLRGERSREAPDLPGGVSVLR